MREVTLRRPCPALPRRRIGASHSVCRRGGLAGLFPGETTMGTTKRLRTKDEELAYKRIMILMADADVIGSLSVPPGVEWDRALEIAKMVSDDIKRMAKVPL